jgi:hypothetical protein
MKRKTTKTTHPSPKPFQPPKTRGIELAALVALPPSHPFGIIGLAGCCDACMTNIRWAYTVRTAEGVEFVVGSDCAQKAGMTVAEIKAARRAYRNDKARECVRQQQAAREDSEREFNQKSIGFAVTDRELHDATHAGKAAAKQWLIAARKLDAVHLGEVGKRARGLCVLVDHVYSFETAFGVKHIWILRDRANNCLIWKSTSCFYDKKRGTRNGARPRLEPTITLVHCGRNGEGSRRTQWPEANRDHAPQGDVDRQRLAVDGVAAHCLRLKNS